MRSEIFHADNGHTSNGRSEVRPAVGPEMPSEMVADVSARMWRLPQARELAVQAAAGGLVPVPHRGDVGEDEDARRKSYVEDAMEVREPAPACAPHPYS